MSDPREHMKRALWHAKAAIGCLRKAADAIDIDIDEPVEEELIEPPSEQDVSGPDFMPTPFDDEPGLENPQSRYLRLLRGF